LAPAVAKKNRLSLSELDAAILLAGDLFAAAAQ
jgi:hypothetical protein